MSDSTGAGELSERRKACARGDGEQARGGLSLQSICRKWAGGPLLAIDCGTEVRFEEE